MKKTKSCLFLIFKSFIVLIISLSILIYFLSKDKPYTQIHPPTEGPTVSIILIDGLSNTIFKQMLADGKLPNLNQLILKSTYIEHGIASFPSMTGYGFYPIITGLDAAESGIMGLRWFDRTRENGHLRNYVGRSNIWMNQDIDKQILTYFEKYNKYYTSSINTYMNRGVHHAEMTGWAHTTSKYQEQGVFPYIRKIPKMGKDFAKNHFEHESMVLEKALQQLARNPKVQWITFPSPDASNHVNGTTAEYYQILTHIDSLIGRFVMEIEALGQSDTRMLCVVTDHGISDVNYNLDIIGVLKNQYGIELERGNSANIYSTDLKEGPSVFMQKNGYFVINGNLSAYIYLRDTVSNPTINAWKSRHYLDFLAQYRTKQGIIHLPKAIADIEGVELVACKANDSTVSIFSRVGESHIVFKKNIGYKYHFTHNDPLGYGINLKNIKQNTFYDKNTWLAETINTEYPDAIYRLYQLMSNEKAGDMLITSAKGYDLAPDYEVFVSNYKGGHGGLRGELLDVPYIVHIPKDSTQKIPYMRVEDVGRMIGAYLEKD
jgi:hypothetical protein